MRASTATLTLVLTAIYFSNAMAQSSPPNFRVEFERHFNSSADKLVSLAMAMPDESYSWSPMEGVKSVVSVYMHIARYNYYYPDIALGVSSPMGSKEYDSWEEKITNKGEAIAILAESMEHVRKTLSLKSSKDLENNTRLYGRDVGQWAVFLQLVSHMNEHLWQLIAYARMNRVVPPWSK